METAQDRVFRGSVAGAILYCSKSIKPSIILYSNNSRTKSSNCCAFATGTSAATQCELTVSYHQWPALAEGAAATIVFSIP